MMSDTSQPEIARATAIWLLGNSGYPTAEKSIIEALKNENALIRYYAVTAMEPFSDDAKFRHLSPLLSDPVMAIRTQARFVLGNINEGLFHGEKKEAFSQAEVEFDKIMKFQADFPSGQLMKGQFKHKMGDLVAAEQAYTEALQLDPYLPQPYLNLARIKYGQKQWDQAERLYKKVLEFHPESVEANYSLGLLLAERSRLEEAHLYLGKAAQTGHIPRHYYNWGLTLQTLNKRSEAEKAFLEGLSFSPNDEGLLYAITVLYTQLGQKKKAITNLEKLQKINPQNNEYRQLEKAIKAL